MIEFNKKLENRFRIDSKKLNKHTNREELQVVHYTKDGHIEMTNSYIAMRVSDVHDGPEDFKHGKKPGSYPDMNTLFGKYLDKTPVRIPVQELENTLESFKRVKPDQVSVFIDKEGIGLDINIEDHFQDGSTAKLMKKLYVIKPVKFTVNYEYLLICLKFIRLLGVDEVDLYHKDLSPLSLVHENLEVILAQIRTK